MGNVKEESQGKSEKTEDLKTNLESEKKELSKEKKTNSKEDDNESSDEEYLNVEDEEIEDKLNLTRDEKSEMEDLNDAEAEQDFNNFLQNLDKVTTT
jgi:RNA polymerase-binding transcription factor DksA